MKTGSRTHTATPTHARDACLHRLSPRPVRARQIQLQMELREGEQLREILSGMRGVKG